MKKKIPIIRKRKKKHLLIKDGFKQKSILKSCQKNNKQIQRVGFISRDNIMRVRTVIVEIINQVQMHLNLRDIFQSFKSQIQNHIIQSMSYRPQQLQKKYYLLCKKYQQNINLPDRLDWIENQKKIFINLLLAFCCLKTKKISQLTEKQWILFSETFNNKNVLLLKYEIHSIKNKQLRVSWNQFSQLLLQQCVSSQTNIDWSEVSRFIYFKSSGEYFKTPKQCREHWFNHLDEKIVKGGWSIAEDLVILQTVIQKGKKWAQMVSLLDNRRTEHMIKNRFNSLITCAKKLIKTNPNGINQNEIIAFMKQKIASRQQSSKSGFQNRKNLKNLLHENKIMSLSLNMPQDNFHLSNEQNYQNMKQKEQVNPLKTQSNDSVNRQQNSINLNKNQLQEDSNKIKNQCIKDVGNIAKNQESLNTALVFNINQNQSTNLFGFYTNQYYIDQSYPYYYSTIIYSLI